MGKLKASSITSDPASTKVADLKADDLASQLLMQLFYGKSVALPVAPKEDVISEVAEITEKRVEDTQIEEKDDDKFEDYEPYYSDDEDYYDPDYDEEYESFAEEYQNQLASYSSKRLTSSHNTNYYENKLRSKSKWKQEKVNPDRFQNATRAAAHDYRVNVYQNNDLCNKNEKPINCEYRNINYSGTGCSSSSTSSSKPSSRTRNQPPSNYNENEALQRAIQESQQEHMLRSTSSATGLSLNQLRDLQNREFSPEDYEMLLLLDKQIAPKCLTLAQVRALPCKILEEVESLKENPCMVCLCEFELLERVRTLGCGHVFHDECVTQWLTGSSTVCPTCKSSVC